jgi:hypothetical protein
MNIFLKRFLIFTLVFTLLIIMPFLYVCEFDNIDKESSNNQNIISLQSKSKYDSLDILFVGNSYCYSAINTNYLDSINISSYNLGIASAGVQFYELITNDYLDNVKSIPKKVLILVSPMTFSSKSDNFSTYPIHRYLENEKSNFEVVFTFNRLNDILPFYKKSFRKALENLIFLKAKQSSRKINKGYIPSEKIVNNKIIENRGKLYLPLLKDEFDNSKIEYLLEFADKIKRRGSEVVFFELPTYKLKNYFNKNYLKSYKKSLKVILEKHQVISLNETIFTKNNFRDIDHMNSSGAYLATKNIIGILNKNE